MGTVRKRHGAKLKCDVALEAIKGGKTVNEIAMNYKVHPVQVSQWKKHMQEALLEAFSPKKQQGEASGAIVPQLYEEIGRLKFELDWLKKKIARFN
jgi:transposase-like protein